MARPRSDVAPRIVHAARERFLKEGVDGASLRAIARDAKTNIGMVYYYFPTKDDLFLAVVEEVYQNILRDLEAALAANGTARDRLERAFSRFSQTTEDELKVVRLVIREALVSSERLARVIERFQRGHLPLVLATLADGVGEGAIDGTLPLPMLVMCTLSLGVVPQLMRHVAGDHPPFAALPKGKEMAARLVNVLFSGIGARQAPRGGED